MDAYKGGSRKQLALQRRLDALFRALASDFLLREQFITDPAQIASEYINGKRIAPDKAAAMNYLIYACLANNYLISWLRDYAMRSDGKEPITQQRFVRDFSAAVVEQRAHHVVSALAHFALHDTARIQLDDNWLQVIFGRWHHFGEDGTDDATDSTGTDSTDATDSTDSTGTDATDSTGTDTTGTDSTGTDSTGTDATGTDGTGTDATDATDSTDATDITATGTDATDSTGTDQNSTLTAVTWKTYITDNTDKTQPSTTPFTHTGMTRSPITTATTLNTERFLGTSHVIITLEALTSYARHLIRSGALDDFWSEQGPGERP
ncbi:hypothetical protein GTP56_00180 [Duganella sp. FT134W]|uniref:Uncharacterized protein n=1 Tax=Duganella margarita TaxID=2692170 RepID=A0A7X4GWS9_9BURK|nr:hypothetical protein [Duganella margarita]MYM70610.1 hypothetical protein [Duganella margarita]